jgi:hypothetical protein
MDTSIDTKRGLGLYNANNDLISWALNANVIKISTRRGKRSFIILYVFCTVL